jgi:hypothetical protein
MIHARQPVGGSVGRFDAVVYDRGRLHVRLIRHDDSRTLCGRDASAWEPIPGWEWNGRPEARCQQCFPLPPGAVLRP